VADDPTTQPTGENDDTDRTTPMTSDETRELPTGTVTERPLPRPRVGWHDTDVTSLVFGLLFLGIALVWLLVQQDVVSWPDASRIFPIVLVVAGVVGLVSSLTRSRRTRRDEELYPPA
jgi:hypothetical protein